VSVRVPWRTGGRHSRLVAVIGQEHRRLRVLTVPGAGGQEVERVVRKKK
jgi:hypothetical protein